MTGVEILATETIYATILPEWCFILGVIFATIFILLFVSVANLERTLTIIFGILVICSTVFCAISQINSKTDVDYIEYKVTISDEVSMNEFYEKYEVLDQEGEIYTVREREN